MIKETVIWGLPILLIWVLYHPPQRLPSPTTVLAMVIGAGLLVLAAKRPDRSLLTLIIVFPFQGFILARLWGWGLPTSLVKHLGSWKELLALGVVVAGLRNLLATDRRMDGLDKLAMGYVLLVALYALLQTQIAPSGPSATSTRLLGFRESAGFVLLLFGARHAPLGPNFGRRAARALLGTGALVAACGIYEAVDSGGWNRFVVNTIGYTKYEISVLNNHSVTLYNVIIPGSVGGANITRIGSVFTSALNLSFWLVLPFAIGFERMVRRIATPATVLATLVIGAALLLTQTRSAIIAAVIVAFLALQPAAGRPRHWRTQAALVLAGLVLVALPGAFASGLSRRVAATNSTADNSSAGHLAGFNSGVSSILHHPLGQGLGTAAGVGQRFSSNKVIPENYYLDVGVELGIFPMLVFIALVVALTLKLRRAARRADDPLLTAAWAAGVGLAVSAFFLQTWLAFEVAWTYWGVAGAMLYVASRRDSRSPASSASA